MALKLSASSPSSSVADSRDAAGVVAGGDGLHGVGEGLDGPRDLLGEIEREPAAGEEREAGRQQQEEHVEVADLAALAEERPVGVGGGAQTERGGGRCRREWGGRRRRCRRA